jgi:hypothetical protein
MRCFGASEKSGSKESFIMNDKVLYWGSVVLSALALVLLVANVCIINGNRSMQVEIGQHQGMISNSVNMSQLNQALVQALAQASIDDDDKDIHDLLAGQGITVKPKADKTAPASK